MTTAVTPGRELLELAEWCRIEREKLGAIDGYDYRSGEEFGLRRAQNEIESRLAAKPADEGVREAWQWHGDFLQEGDPDWVAEATEPTASGLAAPVMTGGLTVRTARGNQRAHKRDWIVRVDGEIHLFSESAWAILSLPSAPVSDDESRYIKDIIRNAMLTMWNEICSDTGCHPLDITHSKGRHLEFHSAHWSEMTANMATDQILKLNIPAPVSGRDAVIEECAKIAFNIAFAARQAIRSAKGRTKRLQAVAGEETAQQITKAIRALSNHKESGR